MRKLFAILLLFVSISAISQNKYTISGNIKDASNGEDLIGAAVRIEGTTLGAISNVYGFYSLSLSEGSYTLNVSYLGFQTITKEITVNSDIKLDFEMSEEQEQLEEVVVTAERADANVTSTEMSVNKLDIKTIQKMPALLGEVDVIRSIQLLPGVSTVGEGASGFNVRGGSVDQNLILLDEAPVYNSSHLFGFFSVFNPDAVKDVKLIKGGIPAQYGGRLSSVLDIRNKEGNLKEFGATGGVGLIFSRLTVEAPIVKDKASFLIAGRRSYADVLAAPFLSDDLSGSQFYFYDLSAKVNYKLDEKNRLFLSGYFGRDVFGAGEDFRFNWGNATGTLRWNHLFNDKLFFNLSAIYSDYDYELGFGSGADAFDWSSRLFNYSLKPEFTWYANSNNTLTFGAQSILFDFEPANASGVSEGVETDISLDNKYGLETAFYVANEQKVGSRIALKYGLRYSIFDYMGPGEAYELGFIEPNAGSKPIIGSESYGRWETIKLYGNLEPRFAIRYELNEESSIKASYNRMAQYVQLVSNTTASIPLDVWNPSTNNIEPALADQVALGYFRNFKNNAYETSVEVYYKESQNLLEFIDNADLLINPFLEADLLPARGRAYGAEFFVKKTQGRINGWVSYTLSRAERKAPGINNTDWFPSRFDQTHNVSVVGFYDVSKRVSLSANFTYISGTPATFATNGYYIQGFYVPHNPENRRNNYRNPAYHRLDLSMTINGKKVKKNGKERKNRDYLVISIYNVYNRANAFSVFQEQFDFERRKLQTNPGQLLPGESFTPQGTKYSIIARIIPSISYNFEF